MTEVKERQALDQLLGDVLQCTDDPCASAGAARDAVAAMRHGDDCITYQCAACNKFAEDVLAQYWSIWCTTCNHNGVSILEVTFVAI